MILTIPIADIIESPPTTSDPTLQQNCIPNGFVDGPTTSPLASLTAGGQIQV